MRLLRTNHPRSFLSGVALGAALIAAAGFALDPASVRATLRGAWQDSERRTPVVEVVEIGSPAVVAIEVPVGRGGGDPGAPAYGGEGSGVLINARGYLLTNYHVVRMAGLAPVRVRFLNGSVRFAERVAESIESDLALLRIAGEEGDYPYVKVGASESLFLGETVVALGNPYGWQHTVSTGVVSALRRRVKLPNGNVHDDFIQTDAAINPGNSGGPLLNIVGELVGLNTAIYDQGWGIAFATPVDRIKVLLADYVEREHHFGVSVEECEQGVRVAGVESGAARGAPRLEPGDLLRTANGQPVVGAFDFIAACLGTGDGEQLLVRAARAEEEFEVVLATWSSEDEMDDILWETLGFRCQAAVRAAESGAPRSGLEIVERRTGGPAERVDLRAGDFLFSLSVAGEDVAEAGREYPLAGKRDLVRAVLAHPGELFRAGILRDERPYVGEILSEELK